MDIIDIMKTMCTTSFSYDFKHYYDLLVSTVLTIIKTWIRWLLDDVPLRKEIAQYGLMLGCCSSFIKRGGGVSHHIPFET